jgi:sulfoxide reductase heme-binding subunit YedZ
MIWLVYAAIFDHLGANPAEALVRSTGDWTLRMLCLVLAITPMRVVLKLQNLASYRRMAGLFVYFYAWLHMLSYAWFDMGFELADISNDILKRPFILVGFSAVVALTPLALTSFNRAIRYLGAKRWQHLHRLVYLIAGLAILHFFWMRAGKNNFFEVAVYAVVLGCLLGWRLFRHLRPV